MTRLSVRDDIPSIDDLPPGVFFKVANIVLITSLVDGQALTDPFQVATLTLSNDPEVPNILAYRSFFQKEILCRVPASFFTEAQIQALTKGGAGPIFVIKYTVGGEVSKFQPPPPASVPTDI